MDYLSVIARNVERLRIAKGYTKNDLAGDSTVSHSHVQNILRGQNSTIATLAELAQVLGVGLEHLVQPELEVVSITAAEAKSGVPASTPTKVYVVRDKTSKRRLRSAVEPSE